MEDIKPFAVIWMDWDFFPEHYVKKFRQMLADRLSQILSKSSDISKKDITVVASQKLRDEDDDVGVVNVILPTSFPEFDVGEFEKQLGFAIVAIFTDHFPQQHSHIPDVFHVAFARHIQ